MEKATISEIKSRLSAYLKKVKRDSGMIVWCGTLVECASAIARREREGALGAANEAFERLRTVAGEWHEMLATDTVRSVVLRVLRVHALRAGESLQLAAAFVAAEHDPPTLEFVSLDDRLSEAAGREGFRVFRV